MGYTQQRGKQVEDIVRIFLSQQGWRVQRQNYFTRYGEIDLICLDPVGQLVFVEVKSISENSFLDIWETISITKLQRLTRTIEYYLLSINSIQNWYLEFVGVVYNRAQNRYSIYQTKL